MLRKTLQNLTTISSYVGMISYQLSLQLSLVLRRRGYSVTPLSQTRDNWKPRKLEPNYHSPWYLFPCKLTRLTRTPTNSDLICIPLDKPLKRNTPLTEPRYRFDKTNDDLLHNTLKDSLTNIDKNITTQDELEELAVTLCDKLMKAVDTFTPKVYSRNDPKSPVSQAIPDLIKEKRRLRRLDNNTQDPNIKSTINRLQKEIRTKINPESTLAGKNSATPLA